MSSKEQLVKCKQIYKHPKRVIAQEQLLTNILSFEPGYNENKASAERLCGRFAVLFLVVQKRLASPLPSRSDWSSTTEALSTAPLLSRF
ncbi:hypothetical protein Y032_0008g20 [Ancylostoma ceylanicum]|uniref:Uncharacterized protein n=1 Tax=Ancylostoma ceylanicum TaxID=53326 RepID=A0A016VM17_9BILA|nr:hypothetical protein Y032_0008g20 [Ancylostoma ceylanicum]